MKKKVVKKLTKSELSKNLLTFKKDLFNLRFSKVNGQTSETSKINSIKKSISRILTEMNGK